MVEIVQGSPEWHALRVGRVTASRVADVIAKTKTGYGASRANYMAELIAERLTGIPADKFTNAAMQHGTEYEPEARTAYEFYSDVDVEQAAFVLHPKFFLSGASPDGLVGTDGLVEIKCPSVATHLDTLLNCAIPGKYTTQMMWQMACTGRKWCDFVSYDPRMPEHMRIWIKRIERNDDVIAALEKEVSEFLDELRAKEEALTRLYPPYQADDASLRMAG